MKGFPALDVRTVDQPSPSALYALPPADPFPGGTECLTSYVARLARAHRVLSRTLIKEVIREEIPTAESLGSVYGKAHSANGVGTVAREWSGVLEAKTGRTDLDRLTLQPLRGIVSERRLLRETKAWCGACLREWAGGENPLAEPLLWQLEVVVACPIHEVPLQTQCLHCGKAAAVLRGRTRIGVCSHCESWFGSEGKSENSAAAGKLRLARGARRLLGFLHNEPDRSPGDLAAGLQTILEGREELTYGELAERMDCAKNTVWGWANNQNRPTLHNLLNLSFVLGLEPGELLTGSFQPQQLSLRSVPTATQQVPRRSPRSVDHNELQRILKSALEEDPPPSLAEVARRSPHGANVLKRHFPQGCRTVSRRFKRHRGRQFEEKTRRICQRVETTARSLHQRGIYPSKPRIEESLSNPGYFQLPEVRHTWKRVLSELGYR